MLALLLSTDQYVTKVPMGVLETLRLIVTLLISLLIFFTDWRRTAGVLFYHGFIYLFILFIFSFFYFILKS